MRYALIICLISITGWSCRDRDLKQLSFFTVTLEPVQVLDLGQLQLNGSIDDLLQENADRCGFIWSTSEDSVQLYPDKMRQVSAAVPEGNGNFNAFFSIAAGEVLYFRAFAELGPRRVFSDNTRQVALGAVVETIGVGPVENDKTVLFGRLIGLEALEQNITAYGHVYSAVNKVPDLTATDCFKTEYLNGNGDGPFSSPIDSLEFNTTYYVRAYATDGNRTFYSLQVDTFRVRDGWQLLANGFPTPFADGVATASDLHHTAYAGFGTNNVGGLANDILKEFWNFNPDAGSWQELQPFTDDPGLKRTNASLFALGDTVYLIFGEHNIASGSSTGTEMLRNFWKYSILNNTWEEVSVGQPTGVMPPRSGAAGFVLNGKIYVGAGKYFSNNKFVHLNDFWEYNPQSGKWRRVKSLPMNTNSGMKDQGRFDAVGFASTQHGFVGGGDFFGVPVRDFWKFTAPESPQDSGKWEPVAELFPGPGRVDAISFAVGNKAYYGAGFNLDFAGLDDFYEFDMNTEKWRKRTDFQGGPRYETISFGLGDYGYAGCGIQLLSENGQGTQQIIHRDIWRYIPEKQ